MDFNSLAEEHEKLCKELEKAIQIDGDQKMREIDRAIVANFKRILDHKPLDSAERRAQLGFLLDLLCPKCERDRTDGSICDKIIELADMQSLALSPPD